jgi:hypothetical protein
VIYIDQRVDLTELAEHTYVTYVPSSKSPNRTPGRIRVMASPTGKRTEKLQIMLSDEEIVAIDDWRFQNRLPSRAAAIRELISRGLHTDEFVEPPSDKPTNAFAVTTPPEEKDG